ncbi:Uncharacterised protein [Mycobacterium tuberculosis]|uniref:Uncharacterized protein n=1 Tax=Mycobacterium tuberculosis TaxID=1773 RepID=A0A654TJJ6_MYCTX|nr:Uncharacterised protein [Mycobacterium tuberculosis]COX48859.1 Uncharacterised protein [Mycobacterium tuberculosis]
MQVSATETAGHAGDHQGPDHPGAVTNPNGKMRNSLGVQIAHHVRIGHQIVRQHHQIHARGSHRRMWLAAVPDPGTGAAQRLDEQV